MLSLLGTAMFSATGFAQGFSLIEQPPEPVRTRPVQTQTAEILIDGEPANASAPEVNSFDRGPAPGPLNTPALAFPSTPAAPLSDALQPKPKRIPISITGANNTWTPPTTPVDGTLFSAPTVPQLSVPTPTGPTTTIKPIETQPSNSIVENSHNETAPISQPTETFESFDVSECVTDANCGTSTSPWLLRRLRGLFRSNPSVNSVVGISYLNFERDYGSQSRLLSSSPSGTLSTASPDEGNFGGFEFNYARRGSTGRGFEFRYFRFDPGTETVSLDADPVTNYAGFAPGIVAPAPETIGLSGIGVGAISMATVFNDASIHRVARDSSIDNLEINLLKLSPFRGSCNNTATEFVLGFRMLDFDDTITYSANDIVASATNPDSAEYVSDVSNFLAGIQLGARTERQIRGRLSLLASTKFGVFNNRIENRQMARYNFADGSTATPTALFGPNAGQAFNLNGEQDTLALLGEIDLGIAFQLSSRLRARVGYRGIAVSNIAEAHGQFAENLTDFTQVQTADDSGHLMLGGGYYGLEFAY
jgi:hypothetical protein